MIAVTHAGGDRLTVEARGHRLVADQPARDGGEDTGMTPTELFVAGLAACVAHYAQRFLRRNGLSADGLKVTSDYTWAEGPHRVGRINLVVDAPGLTPAKREAFSRVVEHCTVHNSMLHPPEIRMSVEVSGAEAA